MKQVKHLEEHNTPLNFTYADRHMDQTVSKYAIPEEGMDARVAYQVVKDELNLDGNPALNLASFVTTWMEPEADQLLKETANKNLVDQDEYPQTEEIHQRVVSMMGRMLNAPKDCDPVGTCTVGSSEAIMLGLLAHKWSWKKRRSDAGLPTTNPNVVFSADVHTCWEKFARYFDVEMRVVPLKSDQFYMTADQLDGFVDENTCAVGCVIGTTFTGQLDDVRSVNDYLLKLKAEKGWDIPIHCDGASGGFVAPFVYPEVEWDFRLEQVKSVNISNHKFGLVYPGIGTVVFRDRSDLPEELVFNITYLGGSMPNYSLNFSRASSMVLLQYYNFLRLGQDGYRRIMKNIMDNAQYLEAQLLELDVFELLNESKYLPTVTVRLKDRSMPNKVIYMLSDLLRQYGWIVPAYALPPNAEEVHVLRMVVKENFSRDMAEKFAEDMKLCIAKLKQDVTDFEMLSEASRNKGRIC
ncbi:glutamate decarboxylase [Cerasicoccus arenae]|uniref:Glutamate decarboxylase n=1 Tax=Cerasicoccus arenae TaxID=424488 RepID=A0A8J3DKJ1_9BACT|nr:glutamate decarboxylase [Cerasicoccus arenae]MBK1858458.1 glutamate decarboxylase [Cerasicoccus arenae]GHC10528.1 glutamate decarboxylase [Cerasicoccus arenae]